MKKLGYADIKSNTWVQSFVSRYEDLPKYEVMYLGTNLCT
jgi:hypothetical protein